MSVPMSLHISWPLPMPRFVPDRVEGIRLAELVILVYAEVLRLNGNRADVDRTKKIPGGADLSRRIPGGPMSWSVRPRLVCAISDCSISLARFVGCKLAAMLISVNDPVKQWNQFRNAGTGRAMT